jgi:hypothetical protein
VVLKDGIQKVGQACLKLLVDLSKRRVERRLIVQALKFDEIAEMADKASLFK